MRDKKLLHEILTGVKILVASNSLELAHFNFCIPVIHFYLNGFLMENIGLRLHYQHFFLVKTYSNDRNIKECMLTDRVFINLITSASIQYITEHL